MTNCISYQILGFCILYKFSPIDVVLVDVKVVLVDVPDTVRVGMLARHYAVLTYPYFVKSVPLARVVYAQLWIVYALIIIFVFVEAHHCH